MSTLQERGQFLTGAYEILGCVAADVINQLSPADLSDPHVVKLAQKVSQSASAPDEAGAFAVFTGATTGLAASCFMGAESDRFCVGARGLTATPLTDGFAAL